MSKLQALKITESPYAFASFAAKHNALVDLIAGMTGQNGVSVTIAERNAIIRGSNANSNGGGTIANLATASVVTSDGRLQNVLSNSSVTTTYPSAGRWVTGSGNVSITGSGVSIESLGKYCNIAFAQITSNISVQNTLVCDTATGTQKWMLVLGSTPQAI